MGVYIRGMEMPTSCYDCDFAYQDQDSEHNVYWTCAAVHKSACMHERRDDCPLVPVPPHGRLGDLDALYEKFSRLESEAMSALKTTTTGSVNWIKWSAILTERTGYKYDIADAPTIIPAEEGET